MQANTIRSEQVWEWVAAGWRDLTKAPALSLTFGVIFVGVGLGMVAGLWSVGLSALIPVAVGGFAIVGPLLAVGLYEISRRIEAGEPIEAGKAFFVKTAAPSQIAMMGFALMFLLLVWANAARLIFALFISGDYPTFGEFGAYVLTHPDGLALITVGSIVGGAIAFLVFSISAVSLPMMMERDVDVVTAIATSVSAVKTNPLPMVLWAWIVAAMVAVGFATAFVGLIVAFPLLGHATWHAYRALVSPAEAAQPAASATATAQ